MPDIYVFPRFLQKMSFDRGAQLHELQNIITEITQELMWVNDREEEELMFDWGNNNIDVYIPQKQESYSVRQQQAAIQTHLFTYTHKHDHVFFFFLNQRLMSDLEEKEKHLTKLKQKVDSLLANNHPASDKIEVSACFLFAQYILFIHMYMSSIITPPWCSPRLTWTLFRPNGAGFYKSPNAFMCI